MANALLLKFGLVGLGLTLLGKKSGAAPQTSQADPVIKALPTQKQSPAQDFVKCAVYLVSPPFAQTGYLLPNVSPGMVKPGIKYFATKDELIKNLILQVAYIPSDDKSTPFSQAILALLGHWPDFSTLTAVDEYNLLNALTWPSIGPNGDIVTGTLPPPMLSSIGNAKMDFLRFVAQFIQAENHAGSDMIYVRTDAAFTNGGSHRTINTGCDGVTNQMFGHGLYIGSYTAMRDYIIFASYGGCANQSPSWRTLLTADELDQIIRNYLASAGATNTIGPGGPNSSYIDSVLSRIDLRVVLEDLAKAWKWISSIGPKSNDEAAQDPNVAGDAGISSDPGSGDFSTYG
jgi:hypothetical protein